MSSGFSEVDFDSLRLQALDAYDLVDKLPHGPARVAAWNAYALRTYGDKLITAPASRGWAIDEDTVAIVQSLISLAESWAQYAVQLDKTGGVPLAEHPKDSVPHWGTPTRSLAQLFGMREALEALRTWVAYDLINTANRMVTPVFADRLAAVDKRLETVTLLWIERPPPAIRNGIGDALSNGLDEVYVLGQQVANRPDDSPMS